MAKCLTRLAATTAALALTGTSLILGAGAAQAAVSATKNGNHTIECGVTWEASATFNPALTNDDPDYPNLMVDKKGNPVTQYQNGGFIESVQPTAPQNNPGVLEVQHFPAGNNGWDPNTFEVTADAGAPIYWRIPVASTYTIQNATLTFTVPEGTSTTPADGYVNTGFMKNLQNGFGAEWGKYHWEDESSKISLSTDNKRTFTIDIGTVTPEGTPVGIESSLWAGTGTNFQFVSYVPKGEKMNINRVGTALLTGTYTVDESTDTCVTANQVINPIHTATATPVPTETATATSAAVTSTTDAATPGLAETGANVLGLASGAIALALAGGAVLIGRRRDA